MAVGTGKGGQLAVIGMVIVFIVVVLILAGQNKDIASLKKQVDSINGIVAKLSVPINKIAAIEDKLTAVEIRINMVDGRILAAENAFKDLSQRLSAPPQAPASIVPDIVTQQ